MTLMKKLYFVSKKAAWQKYRMDILNCLAVEANLQVEILTEKFKKSYIRDSDKVKYVGFSSVFPRSWKSSFYPGILYYIVVKKPDVILAVADASQLTEFILAPIAKIMNVRLVYWTHGYDHGPRPTRGFLASLNKIRVVFIEFMLKQADSLILFSPAGKKYLVHKGVDERKIYVAPNTLNTEELFSLKSKVTEDDTRRLRKDLGLQETTKILLFTGRLTKGKKVINAIKAFSLSGKSDVAALVIVGDGPESEKLRKYVDDNKISGVIFLGAVFDEVYLSKLFCSSRAFVMPGYVGLAIVHAYCYGLPLITEDIPYHSPEIMFLKEGINGFKVKDNDIDELAKTMSMLIDDDDMAQVMSTNAVKTAEEASIYNMVRSMKKAVVD